MVSRLRFNTAHSKEAWVRLKEALYIISANIKTTMNYQSFQLDANGKQVSILSLAGDAVSVMTKAE